jgi:hypothetical protein
VALESISQIAKEITPLLVPVIPYLSKGIKIIGRKFVDATGKEIEEKTPEVLEKIWEKIEPKMKQDPVAQAAVAKVSINPQDTRAVGLLEMTLEDILRDENVRKEVTQLLSDVKNEGITVEQVSRFGKILGEVTNVDVDDVSELNGAKIKSKLNAKEVGEDAKVVGVRLGSKRKG